MKEWTASGKWMALTLLAFAAAGCQKAAPDPQPAAAAPATPVRPEGLQLSAKIIRVNPADGYVLAECAVLPNTGEEARVLRGEQEAGRVRFSGPFSFPYAVADVIEGRPEVGDRIRK